MSDAPVKIAALYKFTALPDADVLQPQIAEFCTAHGIRGTLLIAPEGINGTVAGRPEDITALIDWLETDARFKDRFRDAEIKYAAAETMPFYRMKVRLKPEIVTLRAPQADPARAVGTYVAPKDWNALIGEKDVLLIDTRNDYEVGLGTFEGAQNPGTATFTEFKDYVAENLDPARDKRVAMFCTGGIRCEKASSYLLSQGFETVYHLKGGILNYLEQVPQDQSRWLGECFVFDERVSVGHGLAQGEAELCRACRQPLTPTDRARPEFIEGEQCHACAGSGDTKRARAAARQLQIDLAARRGEVHLGDDARAAARRRAETKKQKRKQDRERG